MKAAPNGTARVEFEIRFSPGKKTSRARTRVTPAPLKPVPPQVPRITQLLVLGYRFEQLVRDGTAKSHTHIAELSGLSKSRITHIMNLTLLEPGIQEKILLGDTPLQERGLRAIRDNVWAK